MKKLIIALVSVGLFGALSMDARAQAYEGVHYIENNSDEDITVKVDVHGLLCFAQKSGVVGYGKTAVVRTSCPAKSLTVKGAKHHSPKENRLFAMKKKERTSLEFAKNNEVAKTGGRVDYRWSYTPGKITPENEAARRLLRGGAEVQASAQEEEFVFYPYEGIESH